MWRYLIALVLLADGIGHTMPFMAAWTPQSSHVGFSDTPWIFSGDVGVGALLVDVVVLVSLLPPSGRQLVHAL